MPERGLSRPHSPERHRPAGPLGIEVWRTLHVSPARKRRVSRLSEPTRRCSPRTRPTSLPSVPGEEPVGIGSAEWTRSARRSTPEASERVVSAVPLPGCCDKRALKALGPRKGVGTCAWSQPLAPPTLLPSCRFWPVRASWGPDPSFSPYLGHHLRRSAAHER